uniref:Uncharacterized protein n=1 Tax=Arundo donax TaxID=35708 RepID=A0A0A9BV53_ARUDO
MAADRPATGRRQAGDSCAWPVRVVSLSYGRRG